MKALNIDIDRCTGCHQCELACSFRKLRKFSPCDSRIQIVSSEDRCLSIPVVCLQCRDAPCARVCPVGAIRLDSGTGAYTVDDDRCLGCRMCSLVCPFASITSDRQSGKAIKCDLCDGNPACEAVCAPGALSFEVERRAADNLRRSVTETIRSVISGNGATALPSGLTKLGGSN
jgi:Fe-S-cluster-containing hydrogenase component 2